MRVRKQDRSDVGDRNWTYLLAGISKVLFQEMDEIWRAKFAKRD